ncbi:serine hydrolase [Streptomyces coffeae]|uniref:Serine hydrolase n=1 Tax=Streptomyces coffeae TaxID=621382 RepID=A0ABS1N935_9ACTN|nr:serine hydrolase [Streptomyces coffeae]MBL1096586.1 serine hydrolase [Streptomyces coffeae]
MTRHRTPRRPRAALSVALAAAVLAPPVAGAGSAAAAAPQAVCASDRAGLADKLSRDITAALRGKSGTTAVSLRDHTTGTVCSLRADQKFDSASVVKVTVLAALLRDAGKHHRHLTDRESQLATKMITKSDNDATTKLWRQLGREKVSAFVRAAGMRHTVPGRDGYWGLTQITANDEEKLLELVTRRNRVLSDNSRAYILELMGKVIPSQRWGTPAGAPNGVRIQVKNGWLERDTHGWRVHSVGAFTGGGHNYTMTVLTQDNSAMETGVSTVEAVSRAVHRDLNPGAHDAKLYLPTDSPQETLPAVPGK